MTTKKIRKDLAKTIEASNNLRDMLKELHTTVCCEMNVKENQGKSISEESLLSSFIHPLIHDAVKMHAEINMLHEIYKK